MHDETRIISGFGVDSLILEILRYVTLVGYVLYDVNCKCCLSINMED